jgi:hypothetical protein
MRRWSPLSWSKDGHMVACRNKAEVMGAMSLSLSLVGRVDSRRQEGRTHMPPHHQPNFAPKFVIALSYVIVPSDETFHVED